MPSNLLQLIALFETTIIGNIGSTDTSLTLFDNTTKDGTALASGVYGFIINEGSANEEFVIGTVAGTAVTSMLRGISVVDGKTEIAGNKHPHRVGESIKITNHPVLLRIVRILRGTDTFLSTEIIRYDAEPTFAYGQHQLVTWDKAKDYIDAASAGGVVDADLITAGKVEIATFGEINAGSDVGGSGSGLAVRPDQLALSIYAVRLPTADQKLALAGTSGSPSGTNKYVTNDDTAAVGGAAAAGKVVRADAGGMIDSSFLEEDFVLNAYEAVSTRDPLKIINDAGTAKWAKVRGFGATFISAVIGAADFIKHVWLDTDKIAFIVNNSTTTCTVYVGTVSGSVLTIGAGVSVGSTYGYNDKSFSICRVDATRFITTIRSRNNTNAQMIESQVFSVSGTTITAGTRATIATVASAGDANYKYINQPMIMLDTDKVLLYYSIYNGGYKHYCVVLSLAGVAISVGSAVDVGSLTYYGHFKKVIKIDTNRFVICCDNSTYGVNFSIDAYAGSVSGTTITLGSKKETGVGFYMAYTAGIAAVDCVQTGIDKFAIAYGTPAQTSVEVQTFTVTGVTVSSAVGSYSKSGFANITKINCGMVGEYLYVYANATSSALLRYGIVASTVNFLKLTDLTITGWNIPSSPYEAFNVYNGVSLVLSMLSGSNIVGNTFLSDWDDCVTFSPGNYAIGNPIALTPFHTGFSGLIAGANYYLNRAATSITIDPVYGNKIGRAVSDTSFLKVDF